MLIDSARQAFWERFGGDPDFVSIAPGRINLIGEHTDYSDGFVFPAAIDRSVVVAARLSEQPTELFSAIRGDSDPFVASAVQRGQVSGWTRYAAGIAWALREETGAKLPDLEAVVVSDLPAGAGVSSSAAMELGFGVLWNEAARLGIEPKRLARLGQRCENEFVGVQCGIMDQMASALGRAGHAMFIDTRSLEVEYAPIPTGVRIALCDTKKKRALADSAYNARREECATACNALGITKLRDATMESLLAARDSMSDVAFRRARHVVGENARCVAFAERLTQNRVADLGAIMRASHESLRDDFEVSCPELDAMAEAACAAPGCLGARMTGAGFGGACVALVAGEHAEEFTRQVAKSYSAATGVVGEVVLTEAADGARMAL